MFPCMMPVAHILAVGLLVRGGLWWWCVATASVSFTTIHHHSPHTHRHEQGPIDGRPTQPADSPEGLCDHEERSDPRAEERWTHWLDRVTARWFSFP
jgi:hypothetical protein